MAMTMTINTRMIPVIPVMVPKAQYVKVGRMLVLKAKRYEIIMFMIA